MADYKGALKLCVIITNQMATSLFVLVCCYNFFYLHQCAGLLCLNTWTDPLSFLIIQMLCQYV